jgi:hypothetical protein
VAHENVRRRRVARAKLQALVRDLLARERQTDEMNGFTPNSKLSSALYARFGSVYQEQMTT